MRKVLDQLASGVGREVEQDHAGATVAPKLSRGTAALDWSQDARVITRRISGLSPWPGCRVQLLDDRGETVGRLTLLRARPVAEGGTTVGAISESGAITAGNNGSVEVIDVQPEGKRPMSLADYRRGNRWVAGLRVQSIA
jgi:methionyl-tRNA formyltransferase